jgi:hypothetical protein
MNTHISDASVDFIIKIVTILVFPVQGFGIADMFSNTDPGLWFPGFCVASFLGWGPVVIEARMMRGEGRVARGPFRALSRLQSLVDRACISVRSHNSLLAADWTEIKAVRVTCSFDDRRASHGNQDGGRFRSGLVIGAKL